MKSWLSILLVAAWLPYATTLWPLPSEEGARQASAAWLTLAKQAEPVRDFLNTSQRVKLDRDIMSLTDPEYFLRAWRTGWSVQVFVLLLGLGSIALALRRMKGWKIGIVFASLSYLILVHRFPFQRALRWEQWQVWWMMAIDYPQWGIGAIYREILFPLIHMMLITFFSVIAFNAIRQRFNASTGPNTREIK